MTLRRYRAQGGLVHFQCQCWDQLKALLHSKPARIERIQQCLLGGTDMLRLRRRGAVGGVFDQQIDDDLRPALRSQVRPDRRINVRRHTGASQQQGR